MRPNSYSELYDYLRSLSAELKRRGLTQLSDILDFAAGQAASGFPAEFLGETRIALRRILNEEKSELTGKERGTMANVLRQIDEWFDRR